MNRELEDDILLSVVARVLRCAPSPFLKLFVHSEGNWPEKAMTLPLNAQSLKIGKFPVMNYWIVKIVQ